MSVVIPQVGDLCVGRDNELCFITGFTRVGHPNNNNSVMVILNFDEHYVGKSIFWNNVRRGLVNYNHLVKNNKGVWEISVKEGQDPLFIEWLKQNEEVQ